MSIPKQDIDGLKRIGLDVRIANYSSSGIARYAKGVLRGISTALERTRDVELSLTALSAKRQRYPLEVPHPFFNKRCLTPPHFSLERFTLPIELRSSRFDLVHCTDFFSFLPKDVRALFSVHDVFFLKDPSILDIESRRHYEQILGLLPSVHHVTCISEDGKRELAALGLVPKSRITVIYPGVDSVEMTSDVEKKILQRKFDLLPGFVLFVGTIEPRKNIEVLARAFSRATSRLTPSRMPQFVLAGRLGYRGREIVEACKTLIPSDRLRFLGEVSESDLQVLYGSASLFLFVTRGEGFGFPILEAMSAGVPVITTNSSASAEISGGAAILHAPEDESGISESIVELLSDPRTYDIYRERGLRRAKEFSWSRTGDELLRLYSELSR